MPANAPHNLYNVGEATLRMVGFLSSAAVVTSFDDPLAPLNTKVPRGRSAPTSGLGGPRRTTLYCWIWAAMAAQTLAHDAWGYGYPTQVLMRWLPPPYACSGIGITPNCCIMSRVSVMRQCSRILPSDTRSTEMLLMLRCWPGGGTPKSSPSCVSDAATLR